MSLEEILQKEEKNADCIFLYQEDGAWYAYEHSAFYCYSLLGILEIDWLSSPDGSSENRIVRYAFPSRISFCVPLCCVYFIRRKQNVSSYVKSHVAVFIIGELGCR